MAELSRIDVKRKTGDEPFHLSGKSLNISMLDFWRWRASDLVSNMARGVLAEFIVANALDISLEGVRDGWAPYDLETSDGIRIEVKSAAYIQGWEQKKLSAISFGISKTRRWTSETNKSEKETRRQSDVYVFALLSHRDKSTVDPLNLHQWHFYIVSTFVLDSSKGNQSSISLSALEKLSGKPVNYDELAQKVRAAIRPSI